VEKTKRECSAVAGPSRKGERFVFLTRISKQHGVLGGLKSLMLFQARKPMGDYHINMDLTVFEKWLNEFLFPKIDALKLQKVALIVMDNAPYHCTAQSTGFNPKG
jgi:hypothetical protein